MIIVQALKGGKKVGIIGIGGLGQMGVRLAKAMGNFYNKYKCFTKSMSHFWFTLSKLNDLPNPWVSFGFLSTNLNVLPNIWIIKLLQLNLISHHHPIYFILFPV